jgi:hypothetical protein
MGKLLGDIARRRVGMAMNINKFSTIATNIMQSYAK